MGSGIGNTKRVRATKTMARAKTVAQQRTRKAKLSEIRGEDLQYFVEYECNSWDYRACDKPSIPCNDGVCRHHEVRDFEVTRVSPRQVAEFWLGSPLESKPRLTPLTAYGIKRIIAGAKLGIEDFTGNIINGYYGEEVGSITLDDQKAQLIDSGLREFSKQKTVKDKCEFLLKREYGYLLPQLRGVSYQVGKVELKKVNFGASTHYHRLDPGLVTEYEQELSSQFKSEKRIPLGVVQQDTSGHYRVIDGYHRLRAVERLKLKNITVIIAS